MALTPSNMLPLGTEAPRFELWDSVSNSIKTLNVLQGSKGTLVMFICNHCPFVVHINEALVRLANEVQPKGIGMIAISSNDAQAYPQDGPEAMQLHAKKLNYPFPYLYDETQLVAKAYDAACTPDFYLFDIIKPRRMEHLQSEEPFSSDPYFSPEMMHFQACKKNDFN